MFKLPWFRILPDVSTFNNMIFLPIALYFAKGITWMDVWYGFGIASWIEYNVHRFVYHKRFAKSHKFHHDHPKVFSGTTLVSFLGVLITMFLPFVMRTQIISSTLLWYTFSENVHASCHAKTSICPHVFKRMHRLHHKYPNKNYGVFGGLIFDILCGTFMWKEDATLVRKQQKAAGSLKAT